MAASGYLYDLVSPSADADTAGLRLGTLSGTRVLGAAWHCWSGLGWNYYAVWIGSVASISSRFGMDSFTDGICRHAAGDAAVL